MTKTFTFKHCWVNCSDGYTETVFHDGRKVTAVPNETEEYREKAIEYGYGSDIDAMCREHELLHTFLAEYLGFGSSPTLWALGHPADEHIAPIWEQFAEESRVLAFQVYLNGGPALEPLKELTDACLSIECLKKKALKLLRDIC